MRPPMTPPPTPSQRTLASDIDPVRFEVIRNALLAITEEMGATLRRAAYSTNIKTRGDFSCAFFDRELRTIAQAFAQPSHCGSLAAMLPRAIRTYGAGKLAPGDGILINDPYLGGVHLNDITLITPVFHDGALLGYVANIAHHVDVGGGAPGSIGVSSEIYQEGLVIPPVRFVKGGQIDPDIFALIRSNFRGTREISGDFRAQTAANRLGAQRIAELMAQHGAPTLAHYPAAVEDGCEIAMQLCDLIFRALAPALPERVVAGTKGCVCNIAFGGVNPTSGEYFTYYETIAGGYGATLATDGMDAVQAHFQNTENAPVEETEANYPVRILRYELIENSEGGGRHRGGLGVRRDYTFPGHAPSFSILSDKARFAPWRLFGGEAARPAKYVLNPETDHARELPSKITFQLAPGDVVSVQTPGGGGTRSPLERPADGVVRDVALGKISAARARAVYAVVVDPATQALDGVATAAERARRA